MLALEGDSIILKEFSGENLNDKRYFEWLRDLEIVIPIYRLEYLLPIQFTEVEKYVNSLLQSKNDCFFAIYSKDNNEFIGTQRIGHIEWRSGVGDIGVMVGDKKYWGKGIATQAVRLACDYAFSVLSLRKLTGGTPDFNLAMCKCFERAGFEREGCLRKQLLIKGDYYDHVLYGLFKEKFYNLGTR